MFKTHLKMSVIIIPGLWGKFPTESKQSSGGGWSHAWCDEEFTKATSHPLPPLPPLPLLVCFSLSSCQAAQLDRTNKGAPGHNSRLVCHCLTAWQVFQARHREQAGKEVLWNHWHCLVVLTLILFYCLSLTGSHSPHEHCKYISCDLSDEHSTVRLWLLQPVQLHLGCNKNLKSIVSPASHSGHTQRRWEL